MKTEVAFQEGIQNIIEKLQDEVNKLLEQESDAKIAWLFNMLLSDVNDLFVEKPDPELTELEATIEDTFISGKIQLLCEFCDTFGYLTVLKYIQELFTFIESFRRSIEIHEEQAIFTINSRSSYIH